VCVQLEEGIVKLEVIEPAHGDSPQTMTCARVVAMGNGDRNHPILGVSALRSNAD
jgi:hypothetical protein